MEKDKLIKGHKPPNRMLPWIWTLPTERPLLQYFNLRHELDCADLFVKFFPYYDTWDYGWESWERQKYRIRTERKTGNNGEFNVLYDRRMVMNGINFLIEVDRGTEPLGVDPDQLDKPVNFTYFAGGNDRKTIRYKLAEYLNFAEAIHYRFAVVFTVQDWRYGGFDLEGTKIRIEQFQKLISHIKSPALFLIGDHQEVVKDPQGKHFYSPLFDNPVSLFELTATA
jgi:hypothetical protein